MGRPNYYNVKKPVPYVSYSHCVTTTVLNEDQVDFFVIPSPEAQCPIRDNIYEFTGFEDQNLSGCIHKVADIVINDDACERYTVSIGGNDSSRFLVSNKSIYFNAFAASADSYSVSIIISNLAQNNIKGIDLTVYVEYSNSAPYSSY